jgi:hypothetical protein
LGVQGRGTLGTHDVAFIGREKSKRNEVFWQTT